MNHEHCTILITGGSTGNGLLIAEALASEGHKIVITGSCSDSLGFAATLHPNIVPAYHDITDEHEVTAFMQKIKNEYTDLCIYINNAGDDFMRSDAFKITPCTEMLAAHYFAGIRIAQEFVPHLEKRKNGAIVDLSALSLPHLRKFSVADMIIKTASSYFSMLGHSLADNAKIDVYDALSLFGNLHVESQTVTKTLRDRIIKRNVETPGRQQNYILYHNGPLWASSNV